MKTYAFASLETGEFLGYTVACPDGMLPANTPEGYRAIPASFDPRRSRLDLQTGAVVAALPPRPADTDDWTWSLNADGTDWEHTETDAGRRRRMRAQIHRRRDEDQQRLVVEFKGRHYQADPASRQALIAEMMAAQVDSSRRTQWRTADNRDEPLSPDDLRALFLAMTDAAYGVHWAAVEEKRAL